MAMPASNASMTPVVIMRTAVCMPVSPHQPDAVDQGAQIADVERCLVAVETDIGERASRLTRQRGRGSPRIRAHAIRT